MQTARQRMETLFEAALELKDPAERAGFLERECEGDLSMRARLERLLSAHGQSKIFFDGCRPSLMAGETHKSGGEGGEEGVETGRRVGPYQVRQKYSREGSGV